MLLSCTLHIINVPGELIISKLQVVLGGGLVVHSFRIPPDSDGSGTKVTGRNGMGTEQAPKCDIILS